MSTDLTTQGTEIVSGTLFGTDNPVEVMERATGVAKTLAEVVRSQNLIVKIGQSEHVKIEGWTFLGSMLGVFPVVVWTRPVPEDYGPDGESRVKIGWEARVEARTRSGEVVGAAEAECLRSERTWGGRDDYALKSMAQTRAASKALRLPLGFVMQLAGFNPTPAEEMPSVIDQKPVAYDSAVGTPFADLDENDAIFITEKQRRLMFAMQKERGISTIQLKAIIDAHTGQTSSAAIPTASFQGILDAINAAEPEAA